MPTNDAPTVIVNAFPTPKEQIVSGLIGLAITGAAIGAGFAVLLVVGKISEANEARKAKKVTTAE